MINKEELIRQIDIPIIRDKRYEDLWNYNNYSIEVNNSIKYYCETAIVSKCMKYQIFNHFLNQQKRENGLFLVNLIIGLSFGLYGIMN